MILAIVGALTLGVLGNIASGDDAFVPLPPACTPPLVPPACTEEPSPSATGSATESATDEPTETETPTESPTGCPTGSETPSEEPSATETPSEDPSATETPSEDPSATETPSEDPSATETPSEDPSATETPSTPPPTETESPFPIDTSILPLPPGAPRAGVGETPTETPSETESPSEEPTGDPCPTTVPTKVVFFASTRIPFASMYTFSAKVTKAGGVPVTSGSVSFLLPGYTFTGPVDGNGYARVRTRIAVNVGNYRLNLRYNPADGFAESKQQVGFQVIRTTSSCELYRQLIPNQSRLTGALRYPDRSRIPSVGVVFWYNGRAIANRVTNSIGVATLDTTRGRSGDTFTFSYPGDSKRAGCSKTIRVP